MKTSFSRLVFLLTIWGALAVAAGVSGLLALLPTAGPQFIVAGLTMGFGIAVYSIGWLREAAAQVPLRLVLLVHALRAVPGVAFVWLGLQGRLPLEFAHRAGWGDVAVALAAGVLSVWSRGPGFRRALWAWNTLGLVDLLAAVGTAAGLNLTHPGSMAEIARLPLAVVPLFFVPVLLVSHFVIFRRLTAESFRRPTGLGPIQRGFTG